VFDVSDIRETAYLIVTEIFYAVPDSNNCIEIDGYKSKIPIIDEMQIPAHLTTHSAKS